MTSNTRIQQLIHWIEPYPPAQAEALVWTALQVLFMVMGATLIVMGLTN